MTAKPDPTKAPPKWLALPIVAIGFAIAFAVGQFTASEALAGAVGGTVAVALVLLLFTRQHWRQRWFWLFFAAVAAAHIILLASTPWPPDYDFRRGDALLFGLDLLIVFGSLDLIQRLIRRRSSGIE